MPVTNTAAYDGPFELAAASEIPFEIQVATAGEVQLLLDGAVVSPTLYTVSLNGDGTGTIEPLTPLTGTAYVALNPSFAQTFVYGRYVPFFPDQIVPPLDEAARRDIYLKDLAERALKVPIGTAAPSYEDFAAAFQGNPGGNVESVGLFTTLVLGLTAIPVGTDRVRTSGHSEIGTGAADYAYSEDVDAAYVAANPLTSFRTVTGRGFKLAEVVITPYMLGGRGIQSGDTDATMADDHLPLQAFFDHAFPLANRSFTYDWSGDWATSETIYAMYPYDQAGTPLHDHTQRRFICGKLRPLPLNRQPGGVKMEYLLRIGGYHNHWGGMLSLSGLEDDRGKPNYVDRRAEYGIQLFFASFNVFENVVGEGFARDLVYYDPLNEPATFRAGTDYEVTYPYSNNIGIRFEKLYYREGGAHSSGSAHSLTKNWSAMAHGGVSAGAFDPTSAPYQGSTAQRTRLTFDSTADFRQYDWGKFRLEILPATYTTIAASAAAGTLTWAAGDPVAAGLEAGDVIIPQSGINSGKRLEILSFSGGSNRVVKVSSRLERAAGAVGLETETATAITGLHTRWSPYQVREILSATQVLVYPWMEDRATSTGKWTFTHGFAANVSGPNTANCTFGILAALNAGGALAARCLYGPKVDSVISEATEFGVVLGTAISNVHLGTVIEHIHAELCEFNIIQATASDICRVIVKGGSNLYKDRIWAPTSKVAAGDALMPTRALNFFTLDEGGEIITNRQGPGFLGSATFTLTNRERQREAHKVMDGPLACTLDFDFETTRLGADYQWARVLWVGPTGAAPTGDLTVAHSAELTHRGWTIAGTNPISGPAKPCQVWVHFNTTDKKALLTQFNSI